MAFIVRKGRWRCVVKPNVPWFEGKLDQHGTWERGLKNYSTRCNGIKRTKGQIGQYLRCFLPCWFFSQLNICQLLRDQFRENAAVWNCLQSCLRVTYVSTFRLFQFFPRSSCSFVSLYVIANFGMKILQKFSMRCRETEGSRHKGISLHDRMRE